MGPKQTALHLARQTKHAGFVASKRLGRAYTAARWQVITTAAGPYSKVRPYEFSRDRYRRSFLARVAPPIEQPSELPRRVFAVWTGENELTPTRARNLERLEASLGIEVELVTPSNLHKWVVPDYPLHPSYQHLSLVHRSDYLRAYLLHHHGGGYTDIKARTSSWVRAFDETELDRDVWVCGYRELTAQSPVRLSGALGRDIALHHERLVGNGAFIARSHTPLTAEWVREVDRRMDYYADQLAEFPGGDRGEVVGYPVSWTRLLAGVFQPLQLKYLEHVRIDDSLLLEFADYQ